MSLSRYTEKLRVYVTCPQALIRVNASYYYNDFFLIRGDLCFIFNLWKFFKFVNIKRATISGICQEYDENIFQQSFSFISHVYTWNKISKLYRNEVLIRYDGYIGELRLSSYVCLSSLIDEDVYKRTARVKLR